MILIAVAFAVLAACGGGDSPVGEADAPTEPVAAVPESGGTFSGYISRANDVAADVEERNAGLEGLAP